MNNELVEYTSKTNALVLDSTNFQSIMQFAGMMSGSKVTVPQHLQGNTSDCAAIVMQAMQWGMNPFAVAQKTFLTGGKLGYEAQLVNAIVINNAPIQGRPTYEYIGDWSKVLGKVVEKTSDKGGKYYVPTYTTADEAGLGVIVSCLMIGESEPRQLTVMMSQAYPRFSTMWATDPKQQLSYLAIRKWARLHAPDVILGVYADDEMDVTPIKIINPEDTPKPDAGEAQQVMYPQADYEKNFDSWRNLITVKGKSPEAIIKQAESKGALTDAQKDEIRNGKKTVIEGELSSDKN